jgi:hypothetical protein
VLLVVMPVIVAGCFGNGSGGGASSDTSPVAQSPPPPAATSLSVSYPVGGLIAVKSQLPTCPPSATCHTVRVGSCPPGGKCVSPNGWVRVAARSLTCPLVYGDAYPTAACAALADLARLRKGRHLGACSCPGMPAGYPRARAVGRYKGHRVSIPLDACSLCGIGRFGRAAHRDAAILMPQR